MVSCLVFPYLFHLTFSRLPSTSICLAIVFFFNSLFPHNFDSGGFGTALSTKAYLYVVTVCFLWFSCPERNLNAWHDCELDVYSYFMTLASKAQGQAIFYIKLMLLGALMRRFLLQGLNVTVS